jgi:predicted porin
LFIHSVNFMQRILLPTMVAFGTSGAAQAQSSVTLYGIVDVAIEYTNHAAKDGSATRLVSGSQNTSRFGLRGAEDLGGGLKAVFRLESGIDVANGRLADGPNALFDRRATIGLKSDRFGQVDLGRSFTTTYDFMLPFDPMGYSANYSWATGSSATGGRKDGLFSRASNAVKYEGQFGDFKLGALYGFGNAPGSVKASSKYNAGVGYSHGPFAVAATFDHQNGAGDTVAPADSVRITEGIHLGASYTIAKAKIMAGYRHYRRAFNTRAETLYSSTVWLGGSYDATPYLSLSSAVYHQAIKGTNTADPTLFSLRANYLLSKRTVVYASGGYAIAQHDKKVGVSRDMIGAADTQVGVTAGLQHRF